MMSNSTAAAVGWYLAIRVPQVVWGSVPPTAELQPGGDLSSVRTGQGPMLRWLPHLPNLLFQHETSLVAKWEGW